jgi:hypothetical protein
MQARLKEMAALGQRCQGAACSRQASTTTTATKSTNSSVTYNS